MVIAASGNSGIVEDGVGVSVKLGLGVGRLTVK